MPAASAESTLQDPSFCSQCGASHRQKGRGARFAERLKTIGKAVSGILSILFFLFFISLFLGGGGLFGGGKGSSPEKLYGSGDDKIAVIDIQGIIMENQPSGPLGLSDPSATTARALLKTLEEVKEDESVKAVVLRINSPGGAVTASIEMLESVLRFKKSTGLPVIVSQADVAASGGYFVSLAGDEVIASPTTLTGSIGAIIQSVNFSKLAQNYGVKGVTIASGANKDLLNPFKETDPEHIKILQKIVDEARNEFVQQILEIRKLDPIELEKVADGRVLSGKQALEAGLVDGLGGFDDAVRAAKDKAGLVDATVEIFGQKGLLDSILGAVAGRTSLFSQLGITPLNILPQGPAYLYL